MRWPLVLGLCACAPEHPAMDRGVTAVELVMEPERLGAIYGSTASGAYVPAEAYLGGEHFAVELEAAGGYGLHYVKRSLNVRLRDGEFRGIREWRLSTNASDPSMLRTPLAFGVFARQGALVPEHLPAAVTVNGRYWGLYYLIERIDEEFFTRREVPVSGLYKTIGSSSFFPGMSADIETYFESRLDDDLAPMRNLAELVEAASDEELERQIFTRLSSRGSHVRMSCATWWREF
jgi:spore coat protein H